MTKEKAVNIIRKKIEMLRAQIGNPSDFRVLPLGQGGPFCLVYLNSLTTGQTVEKIIGFLQGFEGRAFTAKGGQEKFFKHYAHLQPAGEALLEGSLLLVTETAGAFAIEAQGWLKRKPKEPETERLIRGPREGFTETLEDNIGMVRRWIRDPDLRVVELRVGRRTKTRVTMMYLSDIAQPGLAKEVRHRIQAIDIDGVLEAGYIEQLITDRRASIFPLVQATERSDKVAAAILEGRVAVLVDKSPTTLIVPTTINELYQTPEDYFFSFWLGSFLRFIRLLGNNLSVALPGLYIALVVYHPELLPTQLALAIAGTRAKAPVPLIAEVLLLEVAVEIFREAGLRLPGAVGQTLGVVAGVVLGLTAVQAGFVSPATLVVVAITAIASFTGPSYSVGIAWRFLNFS